MDAGPVAWGGGGEGEREMREREREREQERRHGNKRKVYVGLIVMGTVSLCWTFDSF